MIRQITRILAIALVAAQLFSIPAAADGEVPMTVLEIMKAAASGKAVPSGAADGRTANPAPEAKSDAASAVAEKKDTSDFIPHPMKYGTAEDVNIGGLEIHAGRWYTVEDGEIVESEPWPDSYLYYSASQSKITLHEFHYKIMSDKIGKDETFAALYIPKDIHIVLEGENELINRGYTTIDGRQYSNGVYAGSNKITFEGNGVLTVNTRSDEGMSGYGINASWIRIEGEFVGLSVFGMSGAFSIAPSFNEEREVIARRADLHPEYHGDVVVKDANPYNRDTYTRYRYILFAIGKELSPMEKAKALLNAQHAQAVSDYDDALDSAVTEFSQNYEQDLSTAMEDFNQSIDAGMNEMYTGMEAWQSEISVSYEAWQSGNLFDLP